MKDAEIERANKLLSLISYDQESGFIKNMAIIESNNNQYLAVGIIKLCGLEAVKVVLSTNAIKSSGNCVSELPRNMRNAAIS